MVDQKHKRATSNIAMLEIVARKLGELNEDMVYIGGCATALFINDPLSLDVRATRDVDCIIDLISRKEYYKFEEAMEHKGFKKSMEDDVFCRWRFEEIALDVMPADEKILGFGGGWFQEALRNIVLHEISNNLVIKSVSSPYFLGMKLEAFRSRGKSDFLASHDYEDIISVVAGRVEIVEEIAICPSILKKVIKDEFANFWGNEQFHATLPGYLDEGTITMKRVEIVLERIKNIINLLGDVE